IFPWTAAFALGFLSHLLSDAWTHAGVRPLLPFSDTRVWIAPKLLRGKSDGPLDALVRLAAMLALLARVATYAAAHLVIPTF
ncbi:MAG TPA: metal-dependent hydrolase, partial [Thermomicrobiales bacterium]|nr:metal-dependent hydrolase [Thermomicrobiales bacterium]